MGKLADWRYKNSIITIIIIIIAKSVFLQCDRVQNTVQF